jgi:NADPH:quinone reductase-like Zn-dependent oxidoreductase
MPKAYVFKDYGGPEVQAFVDLPLPAPAADQLLVAVRAAGVNPVDWKLRSGFLRAVRSLELPAVFGSEVAGVVAQVGEGVDGFAVGDEVFGSPVAGGYAEYTLLPKEQTAHKPSDVSFVDAATLPVAAATAYDGVHQLGLGAGDVLLVNGVGGGVGVAAAQIARALGIQVVGTASPSKKQFVESLGVTHVPYGEGVAARIEEAVPDGVDGIFDLIGGDALRAVAGLLDDRSKLISAADAPTASELGGGPVARARNAEVLRAVGALVENGSLQPSVSAVFPFDKAREALAEVESGHAQGKVVLEIG